PYGAYVTTGVLLWTAFLRVLNIPLQQLQSSRAILSKIGFPWESLLIAGWGEALVETAVYLAVIVGVYVVYEIPLMPILFAIPAILVFLLFGAAVGGLLTPFGVLYEDVPRVVTVATYLLFFLIPIVYPVPTANPGLRILLADPVAILLVTAREVMMSQAVSHPVAAIASGSGAFFLFVLAWVTFRLSAPHLVSKL
ncbi:MAG: ABC transporter permease, partial [Thermoanaerobaculia bacterium]